MEVKVKEINPACPDYIRGKIRGPYVRELISHIIAANRKDEKASDADVQKTDLKEWPFPPISVIKSKDPKEFTYTIVDGVHRLTAAKRLKRKTIPAKILDETSPANLYLFQFTSQDRGLRLDIEQRNLAIKKLVKQYKLPTRQVAEVSGLHWTSIARIASGKQALVKGYEKERKATKKEAEEIPEEIFSIENFFEQLRKIHNLINHFHREIREAAKQNPDYSALITEICNVLLGRL